MKGTKILLIIAGLALLFPIVRYLDKSKKTAAPVVELTEQEKAKQEKEKAWEAERKREKEKDEKERAEREAYQANLRLKTDLVEKLEAVLGSEWDGVPEVEHNGSIEITRKKGDGLEICKFHVTGVTATKKDGFIILNGAITRYVSDENNGEFVPISSLKVSRNPTLPDLLEQFKTAVMEAK